MLCDISETYLSFLVRDAGVFEETTLFRFDAIAYVRHSPFKIPSVIIH